MLPNIRPTKQFLMSLDSTALSYKFLIELCVRMIIVFFWTTTFGTIVLIEMRFGLVEKFDLALIYQIFKLQKIWAQFFQKILVT